MSKFEVHQLPGGEIVLSRTLTETEDGVSDYTQFMIRYPEQKILVDWLCKNRSSWIEQDAETRT
jgi:hypothetical protein